MYVLKKNRRVDDDIRLLNIYFNDIILLCLPDYFKNMLRNLTVRGTIV